MLSEYILKNPGAEYRGMPFWAWNTDLEEEQLVRQISVFKEMGFGGFYMHPRVGLKTPYLSDEFLEAVEICVKEAKRNGLYAGLYDEDRWPSGYGGGSVTKHPGYRATHLLFTQTPYEESNIGENPDYKPNFAVGVRTDRGILAKVYDVILDKTGYLKEYRVIRKDECASGIKWYAYIEENPIHSWYNEGAYVDVMNKEAIDLFIKNTHEIYKYCLGEEFGKVIPSVFTDEPHMIFMTNFSEPFDGTDQFLPWTPKIQEEGEQRYALSLLDRLPELFWEKRSGDESVRYVYHELLSDLFEKAYSQNIGDWCKENGINFTGHYLFEETLFMQNRSGGDMMRMYRDMDEPGMDLLFDDVAVTTGKQIQSIIHQYGKKGGMSEAYGGTNWGFEFRDYKFQSDWQAALGITKRVPHLAWMSMKGEAKRDWPASIFYQSPWYREFRYLEDYFARVNFLLTQGEAQGKIGVIHPLESYWLLFGPESQTGERCKKMDDDFKLLATELVSHQIEFDYLDEALMQELYHDGKSFGEMKYEVILVPELINVRRSTVKILQEYERSGGQVFFLKYRPAFLEGKMTEDLLENCGKVIPFQREEVLKLFRSCSKVVMSDREHGWISDMMVQTRSLPEGKIVFFAPAVKRPHDAENVRKDYAVEIDGDYTVYQVELFRGSLSVCDAEYSAGKTTAYPEYYEGNELMLYCLQKGMFLQYAAEKIRPDEEEGIWEKAEIPEACEYALSEKNVLLLDKAEFALCGEEYHAEEEILRIDERLRCRLGYRKRDYTMVQPYMYPVSEKKAALKLRYRIFSETEIENIEIGMEDMDLESLTFNGEAAAEKTGDWYIDEAVRVYSLGSVKKGENILELRIGYTENTDLEAMYLLGGFGVYSDGKNIRLSTLNKELRFGSIVDQGLAFYGGNISYHVKVHVASGKMRLRVPYYRGACIAVEIDGKRHRDFIICPPYELLIDDLENGMHDVAIVLLGLRYNTLGHLHDRNDKDFISSHPMLWRLKDESWTDFYHFTEIGIMKKPEIYILNK